ncbi:hypothetical protein AK812_SmicGene36761 [Symbiodinium microadriaticum]|uniref:Uncharacterized protein n=1 Tax=Symbiodinium microadriaticum TaxID=2951 RepID=A0A1Q9CI13_SYMMI|nr:hypothetical protein AK812_SmicGene36761 [Symbiodinium microadriaticum]
MFRWAANMRPPERAQIENTATNASSQIAAWPVHPAHLAKLSSHMPNSFICLKKLPGRSGDTSRERETSYARFAPANQTSRPLRHKCLMSRGSAEELDTVII